MSEPKELIFEAPAILSGISYLKDGGIGIRFSTNELSDAEKILAGKFHQSFGFVLFKANSFSESDIPKVEAKDERRTPSQRLRGVLHIKWDQKFRDKYADSDSYYRSYMNRLIEVEKSKLNKQN